MFVLTISRTSSKIYDVWSKTRSPGQILGNSCLHCRGQICDPILMKLCQNVCFHNIQDKFENKLCHVWSKTRSSGQILGNYCLHYIGHICDLILMKLDQNVCLSNFQAKFEYGSCWINKQFTRSNLRKFFYKHYFYILKLQPSDLNHPGVACCI